MRAACAVWLFGFAGECEKYNHWRMIAIDLYAAIGVAVSYGGQGTDRRGCDSWHATALAGTIEEARNGRSAEWTKKSDPTFASSCAMRA